MYSKRFTLLPMFFLLLLLSTTTQQVVGQSVIIKKFFSEELRPGDIFSWEIVHFEVDGVTVTTSGITENNIVEGSIIRLYILKDLVNFDVLNHSFSEFQEHFSITIDDSTEYINLNDRISYGFMLLSSGMGIAFSIVWPTWFVYDDGSNFTFPEEITHRLGSNTAFNLSIDENVVAWTFDNSHLIELENSTQETYVFNASTGVLLSADFVYNSMNFEFSLLLVDITHSPLSSQTTTSSLTIPSSTLTAETTTTRSSTTTTTIPALTSGFYLSPILLLAIIFTTRRKSKQAD